MTRLIVSVLLLGFGWSQTVAAQSLEQLEAYEQRLDAQQREIEALRAELAELKRALGAGQPVAEARAPAESEAKMVMRSGRNGSVTVGGRVHRMLLNVNDGVSNTGLFADSDQGPTMLRVDAGTQPSSDFSIGGSIEVGIQENKAFSLSQDNTSGGTAISVRLAEVHFDHKGFGRMSLGRGFAASWYSHEIDTSGVQLASLLSVGMVAPGLKFVDSSNDQRSNITVGNYFVDVERLLRLDRIRYDSPTLGNGFQVSSSLSADDRWDVALRAKPRFDGWTLLGGLSYQHAPFAGSDRRYDGILSLRHEATGLNLTAGGAEEKLTSGRNARSWVVRGGWLADLNSLGKTAFAVDYYRQDDLRLAGDKASSIGLVVVQKWVEHRFEFYAAYRKFDVGRPDISLRDLDIVYVGGALSF